MGWSDPVLERLSEVDEALIESCGWVWWHQNVLVISDRPASISRDDQGSLHSETGPSIAYRDGWSLWHWHGVAVPSEWIIDKPSLDARTALSRPNIEQRRAACEIIGWDRILGELNAKTINRHKDPEVGELLEVELPDAGKERFLRVRCGTKRHFAIPVPPATKTALEASAWVYGYDTASYKLPEIRT